MHVTAATVRTFGESGTHLGGRVRGIEFHVPFFLDAAAQQVQVEILVAHTFADADDLANAAGAVIDAVLFRITDQARNERRHAHDGIGMQPFDGIPLQFRDAVAHADNAGA